MATEKITFCIGYVDMTLQYHTIKIVKKNTHILQESVVKKRFEQNKKRLNDLEY